MQLLREHISELTGQKVLVRCNFDVPIKDSQVQDVTRIEDCGETLRNLLDHGCKLMLLSHQDRPGGKPDPDHSLRPVIDVLEPMLGETVAFSNQLDPQGIDQLPARIVLLENLRFWPGEEANDDDFVELLSELGEFYVNEAFANCHRQHASIVGIPKKVQGFAGFHLEREIRVLAKVKDQPDRPLVLVIGGAKLESKEPLVTKFKTIADKILVGGKIALDLKDKPDLGDNVMLAEVDQSGKDITEASAQRFAQEIMKAKTLVWNGPMGMFEDSKHALGTQIVGEAIEKTPAFTVIGGGDTEAAMTQFDLEHGIDHISTGGGAMLEFLVKGTLPGIEVLGYEK